MTQKPADSVASRLGRFHIIGLNHRTCPDPIREQLFVADEEIGSFLHKLGQEGFRCAVALSTCNRVEILGFHNAPGDPLSAASRALSEAAGLDPLLVQPLLYSHVGTDAVKHLFRVAASLDSIVIGEPQVLGQVRASHRKARDLGMVGRDLDQVFQAAYTTAKRVRSETAIAQGAVSLVAVALQIARSIHGDLSNCAAAILGADDIALLIADNLRGAGLANLTIADRNARRATRAAQDLCAKPVDFERRGEFLAESDIVLCASGSGQYVLTEELMQSALKARRRRPIFVIDIAVPSDVEPAIERLDAIFLYNLDDLERLALEGKSGRKVAIADAEAIVQAQVENFLGDLSEREAGPLIREMREAAELVREHVLTERPGADAMEATKLLVGRLLHRPTETIRRLAAEQRLDPHTERLIRQLLMPDDGPAGD
ncbi:MAG: glutamyl-tRNA reductase [Rhodospirillaceae bacterium]|nr:glutamyl-tRNA reductase [Rhodospirillaceae bacterium]